MSKLVWAAVVAFMAVFYVYSYQSVARETTLVKPQVSRHFESHLIERARFYRKQSLTIAWMREAVEMVLLMLLIWPRVNGWLSGEIGRLGGGRPWTESLMGIVFLFVLLQTVAFPFALFRGYLMEHAYGFSRQTFSEWFGDHAKMWAIQFTITVPVGMAALALMRHAPVTWWVWMGGVFSVLLAGMVFLAPLVIDPLFFRFKRLEDTAWEARMIGMAKEAGLEVDQVRIADASRRSTKKNAYFTGLGGTKRIVLFDTLVDGSTKAEVESVLAHELGHWKRKHTLVGVLLGVAGSFLVAFLIHSLYPPLAGWIWDGGGKLGTAAGIPLLVLILSLMDQFGMPLENMLSRTMESQADRFSLQVTRDPNVFVDAEVDLVRSNLSDPLPSPWIEWLYYTHPAPMKRIARAQGQNP
ncbi:MAG: M48 family metallopeptidase [Nitrospirae bacterium]|nr:M48 family metallopeptidase [Nitrospirota bacterium]